MNTFHSLSIEERLALILDGLCRAVAARSARNRWAEALAAGLVALIWGKVRRIETRLLGMLARFRAGRLRVMAPGARIGVRTGGRGGRVGDGLPRRFAWLIPLVPYEAAGFGSQLRALLAEPEMGAMLRASPQARRVMAPLCRMLGIEAEVLTPGVVRAEAAVVVTAEAGFGALPEGSGAAAGRVASGVLRRVARSPP